MHIGMIVLIVVTVVDVNYSTVYCISETCGFWIDTPSVVPHGEYMMTYSSTYKGVCIVLLCYLSMFERSGAAVRTPCPLML